MAWCVLRSWVRNRRDDKSAEALCLSARLGQAPEVELLISGDRSLVGRETKHGDRPLFAAVATGQLELARRFLAMGAPVNAVRSDGHTALHAAAGIGNEEMIRLLLEHAADSAVRDDFGHTPLLTAAGMKKRDAIRLLLDHGADIEAKNREGRSAMNMCARTCYLEIAEDLLARGAKASDAEMLFIEVARGDSVAVRRRMAANSRLRLLQNGRFTSPLHYAVERGDTATVEVLLDHGVPVDIGVETYMTALHWAAGKALASMAVLLLDRGADVNARSERGDTPLHSAAIGADREMIDLLFRRGAEIDPQDQMNMTPLAWAMNYRNHSAIEALLARGADLHRRDEDGETLLERGMESEDEKIIALMWEYR